MAKSPPDLVTAIKWHAENGMCIPYVAQVHNKRSEKFSTLSVAYLYSAELVNIALIFESKYSPLVSRPDPVAANLTRTN